MAIPTQRELATQMVAQLRLLDPGISAEIGTPERKIIDAVASSLADAMIDLNVLGAELDLDSKFGNNLDHFLALFGFSRQKSAYSSGYVTFTRTTAPTADVLVPAGTLVKAPGRVVTAEERAQGQSDIPEVTFYTTQAVTLAAGTTEVTAPIRSNIPGEVGNVGASRITAFVGPNLLGLTGVRNDVATTGGIAAEGDEAFKVRFKNTVFRNLAGTQDQFMALAVSTAFTTRANVVGPISRYIEYVQVPPVDDASSYDVNSDTVLEAGAGIVGEYTTALSTVPHSKHVWDTVPMFVSNGQTGPLAVFYRQETDFRVNLTDAARDVGDTRRFRTAGIGLNVNTDAATDYQPNITFFNVYTGNDPDVQAVRPGDVVLFEHSYMSTASRNDFLRNITNCVDVFIDGGNNTPGSAVVVRPGTATQVVNNPTSKWHIGNYRRMGEPMTPPVLGNVIMPLFWQPVVEVPEEIVVETVTGTTTYTRGIHYWGVEDVSELGGTVRARNGIEWSLDVNGQASGDPDIGPYTGPLITAHPAGTAMAIEDYLYDRNIVDLQAALESNKQVTTDVLAHRAKTRFFKLDITVMYVPGISINDTNLAIHDSLDRYLKGLYFGSTVQLSDFLDIIHSVPGVDNVRWSSDVPNSTDLTRVYETDYTGRPLVNVNVQQVQTGTASRPSIQQISVSGSPTSGTFTLTYNGNTSASIAYNAGAAAILSALNSAPVSANIASVTGTGTILDPFRVTFAGNGAKPAISGTSKLGGGPYVIANDFFVKDDELVALPLSAHTPAYGKADTVPGLIIRQKAQQTWGSRF